MDEKTNYQISSLVNEGIIEIVITGEVTKSTMDRLHAEVITIIKEANAKAVLCDIRPLKGPHEEITAAYYRARSIPLDVTKLPAAIVDPSENSAYLSFYETTAANVGHPLKWFTDMDSARAWLQTRLKKRG
jgi:hypothetical protein